MPPLFVILTGKGGLSPSSLESCIYQGWKTVKLPWFIALVYQLARGKCGTNAKPFD